LQENELLLILSQYKRALFDRRSKKMDDRPWDGRLSTCLPRIARRDAPGSLPAPPPLPTAPPGAGEQRLDLSSFSRNCDSADIGRPRR
jgi:hypothetical protein